MRAQPPEASIDLPVTAGSDASWPPASWSKIAAVDLTAVRTREPNRAGSSELSRSTAALEAAADQVMRLIARRTARIIAAGGQPEDGE